MIMIGSYLERVSIMFSLVEVRTRKSRLCIAVKKIGDFAVSSCSIPRISVSVKKSYPNVDIGSNFRYTEHNNRPNPYQQAL